MLGQPVIIKINRLTDYFQDLYCIQTGYLFKVPHHHGTFSQKSFTIKKNLILRDISNIINDEITKSYIDGNWL